MKSFSFTRIRASSKGLLSSLGAFFNRFNTLGGRFCMKVLNFARLTDSNGDLSLTNIAMLIVLVKIALVPPTQLSLSELALLLPVLLNYGVKRKAQRDTKRADIRSEFIELVGVQNDKINDLKDSLANYAVEVKNVKTKVNLQYAQTNKNNTF